MNGKDVVLRGWRNECGKLAYTTRSDAKMAERYGRKNGMDHMTPYACGSCGLWHLISIRLRGVSSCPQRESA